MTTEPPGTPGTEASRQEGWGSHPGTALTHPAAVGVPLLAILIWELASCIILQAELGHSTGRVLKYHHPRLPGAREDRGASVSSSHMSSSCTLCPRGQGSIRGYCWEFSTQMIWVQVLALPLAQAASDKTDSSRYPGALDLLGLPRGSSAPVCPALGHLPFTVHRDTGSQEPLRKGHSQLPQPHNILKACDHCPSPTPPVPTVPPTACLHR